MESMFMLMCRSCRRQFARSGCVWTVLIVYILIVNVLAVTGFGGSDIVIVRSEPSGNERRISGTIAEFTGDHLLIQHTSGREERISPHQVVDIQGDWKDSHKAANALFIEGKFGAAEAKYREALRDEDRRWVRRRVLSQLAWCYRCLGRTDDAVKAFSLLYRDDPKTPYFASIPLTWTTGQAELDLERQAAMWLQDKDSAAARLIGASWSLSSSRRAEAITVLRQFVSDPDPRIVFMAEAQLWRIQVATSRPEDVSRWQERIERMPPDIRGGPYYILGRALSRHEMHRQAAISFMRTAILYSSERDLVPDSLLAAARELETMEQATEAVRLYREILTKYDAQRVTTEAASRLKQLVNEN